MSLFVTNKITMRLPTRLLLLCTCLLIFIQSYAQTPKKLPAKRTIAAIKIDGNIDEAAWKEAPLATDFIEFKPTPGKLEATTNKTEIYILYDNTAIYVAGYCHEKTLDSVSRELIGRDNVGINDFVGIIFDTYLDKINGFGFYVTPLGEQYDARYYPSDNGGEDGNWNGVWDSESKLQKDGWTFEMRIPYSALRFNSKDIQTWGMNITRRRQKTGQQYMWSELDVKKNGFVNQFGEWTGIEKIQSPLRLSFTPYFSTYLNHYPYNDPNKKNTSGSINGGMDVKYGISQSFTLDMTLIPDFGQVQSDNQVLNLTPFEVRYNENRSFFTEGTELFSKGNLFYSRRVGGTPLHYSDVYSSIDSTEHITKNPSETKLINATKISGRTKKKLGVGFFNAVTQAMYATVENNSKHTRQLQTTPLTNYNIFVLDQSLKNNSSVSVINTNVWREGKDYDANVTAFLFDLNNKKNTYNFNGKFASSNQFNLNGKNVTGYAQYVGFSKTGGRLLFQLTHDLTNDKYDHNDLGLLFNNNYMDHYMFVGYRWYKPGKWYNRINLNYNLTYSRRFIPSDYQRLNTNVNMNAQLKNLWWPGVYIDYQAKGNDFYEPRIDGKVFKRPASYSTEAWIESNFAKRYYISLDVFLRNYIDYGGRTYNISFFHRYRFNDKVSLSHQVSVQPYRNDVGFTTIANNDIIFARRDRNTIENVVNIKYAFNNRMNLTTRVRHYCSNVAIKEYYALNDDGTLRSNKTYSSNNDRSLNLFNVDMVYTWQFAPGSFFNIVWKNAINESDSRVYENYFKNFSHTIEAPQNNSLSLKVIYFLDYLQLKKRAPIKSI
jgi:hypothetical protein